MAGSARLFSNFDLLAGIIDPSKLHAAQKQLLQRVLFTVEGEVKKVTPVRTGHLKRSIASQLISVNRGVVGTNVVYAPLVHKRKPYLEWGANNAQGAIDKLLADFGNGVL